jgi:hypothetical protein
LNVSNVLHNLGTFATNSFSTTAATGAAISAITQSGSGASWSNLSTITSPSGGAQAVTSPTIPTNIVTALVQATIPAAATITGIALSFHGGSNFVGTFPTVNFDFGGGPSGTRTQAVPNTPADFTLGGTTDLWNITPTPAILAAGLPLELVALNDGTTSGVRLSNLQVTIYFKSNLSDGINIDTFGFSIPSSSTPQGFEISILAVGKFILQVQMLKAGVPTGITEFKFIDEVSPRTFTFGGINDLFQGSWSFADINDVNFGIQLSALAETGTIIASIGYTTLKVYFLPTQENFNYVTTFEDSFGTIRTLALDASGQWWLEDVTNNPGTLAPLFNGPPADSFASSFTANSRQYLATSDLLQGDYIPQQYNGQWTDRVSQVGPGAPPSFVASNNSGTAAKITNISVTSNVVTITANNAFTAGELVGFTGLTALPALNGQTLTVSGTGLSSTQFEVGFTTPNLSSTAETGTATPQTSYPISSITQPAAGFPGQVGHFDGFLLSNGPGSTSSGNVVTIYTANARAGHFPAGDPVLTAAFNSGEPVYLYISGLTGSADFANGTQLITSIGLGIPPFAGASAERWYFTFTVPTPGSTNAGGSDAAITGQYEITKATMTTTTPIPGVTVGNQVVLVGVSPSQWDQTWTITDTLNSGSFLITQTVASGTVATYSWSLVSGSAPASGELVTVTNTLNADGAFNVTDAVIQSATGVTAGTFTIDIGITAGTQSESGQATTSGTEFSFDPGVTTLGTGTNPIYGTGSGGQVTLQGSELVGAGTRQAVVFFITRNGYWTKPSPPVTFTTPNNTSSIQWSNLPIGPPDTIARGVAFTEAGANGVPGASFFFIPEDVVTVVNLVTTTNTSTRINDNTTTTGVFSFADAVLLNAERIDIQGNDLFNLGELGEAAWCSQFAGRTVWGRVRTKIQNFLNLTFDGGYLPNPSGNLLPLGWGLDGTTTDGTTPTLLVSPVFGNSLYMHNGTGTTQAVFDMLTQSAYQDYLNVAILQNQTAYSVRVTVRTPSSAVVGNLVIDLTRFDKGTGYGQTLGTFTLPLTNMTSTMTTYNGVLLASDTLNIPSDLVLRVYATNLGADADIEIDAISIYPTIQPTNLTQLTMSYQSDQESFDLVTGGIDTTTVNTQPANGGFIMHGRFYITKESSLGYISDSPNQEPANWNPYEEVSNVAGACGINAYDIGEEWAVMACQNGLFLFNGGQPMPINLEIPNIWQAINWKYGYTICVRNDVANRKIFCAIPLPTPNPWMVDATPNPNPTVPNVVLMLNYDGIGSIEQLMEASAMHVTMTGKLAIHDLRRKWSLWTIPTPYLGNIKRNELFSEMMFCNGIQSSKIYTLGDPTGQDDKKNFTSSYCTYGFVDATKAQENPMFGLHNKRYAYFDILASGSGTPSFTFYQNVLTAPYPYSVPGGLPLTNPEANDIEGPLNEFCQRLFVELVQTEGIFNESRLTLVGAADKWSPLRGF